MKAVWSGLICALAICASSAQAALTISTDATQNVRCAVDICRATAAKAVLNNNDLRNLLGLGNVAVSTGTGTLGQQAEDIIVAASLTWVNSSALTLDAYRSVVISQPIESGGGAVALITNDGGSGGALSFGSGGRVSFSSPSTPLTINGTAYTLVGSIASLASAIAANPGGAYALSNNYDASADGTYKSSPIATTLTGTFEGLGNAISNLSISFRSKNGAEAGFINAIGATGAVNDVRLSNARVVAQGAGGVAGLVASNGGSLFGDDVQGSFKGRRCQSCSFQGLAGTNGGTIIASSAEVHMASLAAGAGLVGNNTGAIIGSHASGSIAASGNGLDVGGLVGINSGLITRSYASVTVSGGSQSAIGGLVGYDRGMTTISYATGAVTGSDASMAGGLIGYDNGDTENAYATGAVSGAMNAQIGGFAGSAAATVKSSYSTGAVSGGMGGTIGGFLGGNDSSTLSDCYWDTTTSGTDQGTGNGNVTGLTGLTTGQLQSGLPDGFSGTVWAESPSINGGLPYLVANPPSNQAHSFSRAVKRAGIGAERARP